MRTGFYFERREMQFFVFKGLVRWNKVVYSEGGICYVGGRIALLAREDISGLPV